MSVVQQLRFHVSHRRSALVALFCRTSVNEQDACRTVSKKPSSVRSYSTCVQYDPLPMIASKTKQRWTFSRVHERMASTKTAPNLHATNKLADLTCDTVFMRAFSNPSTVRAFLTAFFDASEEHLDIDEVRICPTMDLLDVYNIFDAHCVLADGSKVIVKVRRAPPVLDFRVDALLATYNAYAAQKYAQKDTVAALVPIRPLVLIPPHLKNVPEQFRRFLQTVHIPPDLEDAPFDVRITTVQLLLAPKIKQCTCDAERWAVLIRDAHSYTPATVPAVFNSQPYRAVVERASKQIPAALQGKLDGLLVEKMSMEQEVTALHYLVSDLVDEILKFEQLGKELKEEIDRLLIEGEKEGADVPAAIQQMIKVNEKVCIEGSKFAKKRAEFDLLDEELNERKAKLQQVKMELMMVNMDILGL